MAECEITGTTAQEEIFRDLLGDFKKRLPNHDAFPVPILHANTLSLHAPFNSEFPFRIYRPRPLRSPSAVRPAGLKEDPLIIQLTETMEWEKKLRLLVSYAKQSKDWGSIQKYPLKPGKVSKHSKGQTVYTPLAYVDVVHHLEKQPIPNFFGNYNWLVTGGNVTHCDVGGKQLILAATGEHQDKLSAVHLQDTNTTACEIESEASVNASLSKHGRIYQTVGRSNSTCGIAVARQLKSCSFFSVGSNSENLLSADILLEILDDKGIFTSVDINQHNLNLCCTLNSDYAIKVWDITTSKLTVGGHIPQMGHGLDLWSLVNFSNTNVNEVFICNRNSVIVKDLRAPLKENIQEFSVAKIINSCEDLTYFLPSTRLDFAYVATSHFLLNLDFRAGWVQRWTHFLHLPPVYGAVQSCLDGSKELELVLLSSYNPADCTALVNCYEGTKPQSFSFPACLPSLGDCLVWAQSQGECLGSSFSKRMKMCVSGLTLMPCENSSFMTSFLNTSIGDVFSQLFMYEPSGSHCIKAYSSDEQDKLDLDIWRAWEEDHNSLHCKMNAPIMYPVVERESLFRWVTDLSVPSKQHWIDMQNWKNTFKSKAVVELNSKRPGWTETVNDLKSFKDLFAGLLLDPWILEGNPEQPALVEDCMIDQLAAETSLHDIIETGERPTSSMGSGSDLDSASVLEFSLRKVSPQTPKLPKKRKRDSQGF